MPLITYNGHLLSVNGHLTEDPACCCDIACCDYSGIELQAVISGTGSDLDGQPFSLVISGSPEPAPQCNFELTTNWETNGAQSDCPSVRVFLSLCCDATTGLHYLGIVLTDTFFLCEPLSPVYYPATSQSCDPVHIVFEDIEIGGASCGCASLTATITISPAP